MTAPACCPGRSSPAWASSARSITRSTCRCISSSAATATSTSPASRSAICSPASSMRCRASARRSPTGPTTSRRSFPEVRLKRYLEMRGADGGPWRRLPALPAFWVGLLYDDDCARRRLGHRQGLDRRGAPEAARRRAEARLQGGDPRAQACSSSRRRRWRLAARGLAPPRAASTTGGQDETRYLGRSRNSSRAAPRRPRSCWRNFTDRWGGSVEPVFTEYAY